MGILNEKRCKIEVFLTAFYGKHTKPNPNPKLIKCLPNFTNTILTPC